MQGDLSINAYCTKLKRLSDQLHDIGHPVSKPSQVLNLLRGLNPRYHYVKPVITSKFPPHMFMSARSFLILEELGAEHDTTVEPGKALGVTHGGRPGQPFGSSSANTDASLGSFVPRYNNRSMSDGSNNRSSKPRATKPLTLSRLLCR